MDISKLPTLLKTKTAQLGLATTGLVLSTTAKAIDTADIDAAFASGKTAMGSVSTGLIAMTAVAVGLGLVIAFMKK